jgi:hypothetical protein
MADSGKSNSNSNKDNGARMETSGGVVKEGLRVRARRTDIKRSMALHSTGIPHMKDARLGIEYRDFQWVNLHLAHQFSPKNNAAR